MISHKLRVLFAGLMALTMSLAPLTAAHAATARKKNPREAKQYVIKVNN